MRGLTKKALVLLIVIFTVLLCMAGAFIYVSKVYQVETILIDGNIHYSNAEIEEMIMKGKLGKNSLYLSYYYKDRKVKDVPFIETIDVSVVDKNTIRIHVYEKALAGFVECLGQYFYFDKDGMVVESSKVKTVGIPQVSGLKFEHIVLNDYLPVEDASIFQTILNITQLLDKYGLVADGLSFDKKGDLTITFAKVRVRMGQLSDSDEKFSVLKEILPELEGKSGLLSMENGTSITFKND